MACPRPYWLLPVMLLRCAPEPRTRRRYARGKPRNVTDAWTQDPHALARSRHPLAPKQRIAVESDSRVERTMDLDDILRYRRLVRAAAAAEASQSKGSAKSTPLVEREMQVQPRARFARCCALLFECVTCDSVAAPAGELG